MADFKLQNTTPAVGNIKLGSSNVSKIYSGSTQVWPAAGGCSYTFPNSSVLRDAVDLWFSNNTAALATYGPISEWCTENVTSMNNLFKDRTTFNDDISNWDVSNVTLMTQMFYNTPLFNQDIGGWDVRNVDRMDLMFYAPADPTTGNRSSSFNQDIGAWDVSNVNYMRSMFVGCNSFNNGGSDSIGNWDVSNVGSDVFGSSFDFTFWYATSFNQDLSGWCVSRYSPTSNNGRWLFSGNSALTAAHTPVWGTCPDV